MSHNVPARKSDQWTKRTWKKKHKQGTCTAIFCRSSKVNASTAFCGAVWRFKTALIDCGVLEMYPASDPRIKVRCTFRGSRRGAFGSTAAQDCSMLCWDSCWCSLSSFSYWAMTLKKSCWSSKAALVEHVWNWTPLLKIGDGVITKNQKQHNCVSQMSFFSNDHDRWRSFLFFSITLFPKVKSLAVEGCIVVATQRLKAQLSFFLHAENF